MAHLDESGEPCTRHAEISPARLLELAMIGSRVPGFHHDTASKLQSLMMALEELGELVVDHEGIELPVETARSALRDLLAVLSANRALAKPHAPVPTTLHEVVQRAARGVGVAVRGELPETALRLSVPGATHALALLLDVAAGPSRGGRTVDIAVAPGDPLIVTLVGTPETRAKESAGESVAIAAYLIERERGTLRCGGRGERFVIALPTS